MPPAADRQPDPASTDAINALPSPLGVRSGVFIEACRAAGIGADTATAAYAAFYRDGVVPESGPLAAVFAAARPPEPVRVLTTDSPEGDVRKFLLPVPLRSAGTDRGPDGRRLPVLVANAPDDDHHLETESVIIPMATRNGTHHTLCVSSQVGCAMGCEFCETAQMGLIRSLTSAEIVAQWWASKHHVGGTVRNIVFMGMGEPLDNLDRVLGAIEVLTDHRGPAIAMRRITISTVGRVDELERLRARAHTPGWKQLNLAVSINAPNDEIRNRIMPVNRAMPLEGLVAALERWPAKRGTAICCEYVLIPGVNDADEHADELAAMLRNVRCCVNVIPYNPRRDSPWPAPEEEDVWRFLARLEANGQFCKRRRTKGRESMAACGQLGNQNIRRRRLITPTFGIGDAAASPA